MRKTFLMTLLLALPLVCFGQDTVTKATPKYEEQPLQLTIKSDKQVYEVGEEINIEANIKNTGKETAKIFSPAYSGVSEIIVINSKGATMEPDGLKIDGHFLNEDEYFLIIPPADSRSHIFQNLSWFSCGPLFKFCSDAQLAPDTYRIYVTLSNPTECEVTGTGHRDLQTSLIGTLFSNIISIEVVDKKEAVRSTSSLNSADWGPAYMPGMEYGPAEKEHAIAMGKAEGFMAQQPFAGQYAKRACAVSEYKSDIFEVSFSLLSDKTGRTRGIVQVNMKDGKCSWLEEKEIRKN